MFQWQLQKESENVCRTLEVAQAEASAPASLRVAWESLPKTIGIDTPLRSPKKLVMVAACEAGTRGLGVAWEATSSCRCYWTIGIWLPVYKSPSLKPK